jgi:hypothetical protein
MPAHLPFYFSFIFFSLVPAQPQPMRPIPFCLAQQAFSSLVPLRFTLVMRESIKLQNSAFVVFFVPSQELSPNRLAATGARHALLCHPLHVGK